MPRTWGYIIVALAAVVGAGALMLPVPEQIEVRTEEAAPAAKTPRVMPQAATPRARERGAAAVPEPAKPAAPAVTPPKPFPMQDTTKTRTMVQPRN